MIYFLTLHILFYYFLHRNSKADVRAGQVMHPKFGFCIRNYEIDSIIFEYSFYLLEHLGCLECRAIRTKHGINSWFIKNHIKSLVRICHFGDIHDLKDHLIEPYLHFGLIHLLDHNFRNIIIDYIMEPISVQIILNNPISTPYI